MERLDRSKTLAAGFTEKKQDSKKNETPLSGYAYDSISNSQRRKYHLSRGFAQWGFGLAFCLSFLSAPFIAIEDMPDTLRSVSKIVLILSPLILSIIIYMVLRLIDGALRGKQFVKEKSDILAQNEIDFQQSLRLNQALGNFSITKSTYFPVVEPPIGEIWKPFRIEHFVSNSLRQSITAKFNGYGGGIFGGPITGSIEGGAKGMAVPNLLDSSSVLFLKNGKDTLRVLIPSPRATKELFVQALEQWLKNLPENSHTQEILKSFSMSEANLIEPTSHPRFIDSLDSSCELELDNRPDVIIKGTLIQEGVALVTSLESGKERPIFLPSGFFDAVTNKISEISSQKISEPNIMIAVKKED
jgi:hypothetical protein